MGAVADLQAERRQYGAYGHLRYLRTGFSRGPLSFWSSRAAPWTSLPLEQRIEVLSKSDLAVATALAHAVEEMNKPRTIEETLDAIVQATLTSVPAFEHASISLKGPRAPSRPLPATTSSSGSSTACSTTSWRAPASMPSSMNMNPS